MAKLTIALLLASIALISAQVPVPAPGPNYAPAPASTINGVIGYTCPSPGSTGYVFSPASPACRFGVYAGLIPYCDLSTDGTGIVGIRSMSMTNCTSTAACPTGNFCSRQAANNGTCTPVAPSSCFAGSLAPSPGPGPAMAMRMAMIPGMAMAPAPSTIPLLSAAAPLSGDK